MNPTTLQSNLTERGYFASSALCRRTAAALAAKPVGGAMLIGPAGSGKSALPQHVAQILDRRCIFAQCFPGTREDDLLVKLIPDADSVSGIKAVDGPVIEAAHATSEGIETVLILDEWDKTRPSADAFLLDFLQSGRIRFNGHSCTADLSKLSVFLTLNDEREVSEPLARRLPRIDFDLPAAALIRQALDSTHAEHPHIDSAVTLYRRCCAAKLQKPATIQELRQLLDAITLLGDAADWDDLVYQFVTKGPEAHQLLAGSERIEIRQESTARPRLDTSAYASPPPAPDQDPEPAAPALPSPSIRKARVFRETAIAEPDVQPAPDDLAAATLVIEATITTYDHLAAMCETPGDDPAVIPGVGKVVGKSIVCDRSFRLDDRESWYALLGESGEICLTLDCTAAQFRRLRKYNFQISMLTASEMFAEIPNNECCAHWTATDSGGSVEFIASLKNYDSWLEWLCWHHNWNRDYGWLKDVIQAGPPSAPISTHDRGPFPHWGGVEIALPGLAIPAKISFEQIGAKPVSVSNDMSIKLIVDLPHEGKSIRKEIQFNEKLRVMSGQLRADWGNSTYEYKPKTCEFSAATYRDAAWKAYDYATSEIEKLVEALSVRQSTLSVGEATI